MHGSKKINQNITRFSHVHPTASCDEEEGAWLSTPQWKGKNSSTLLCAKEEDSA